MTKLDKLVGTTFENRARGRYETLLHDGVGIIWSFREQGWG